MRRETIEGLGKVTFTKRKNSKRITVKIEPQNNIKVSLPHYISYKIAKTYLIKNLGIIRQKSAKLNKRSILFDESTFFKTKWHRLKIKKSDQPYIEYYINDYTTNVIYPADVDIYEDQVQMVINEAIVETLRLEAHEYLPQRLLALASKFNLSYNKVFIKNIKTQWGSCSYKNNINLNLHIMRLPNHLIDYVLYHELCHTVLKNHSPDFWKFLSDMLSTDITTLKKELRSYSPQLYNL